MKKVLITGATGMVGQKLAKTCKELGWQVHYLSTSKFKLQSSIGKGFYWNPNTMEIDASCIDGVEIIFHLAGATVAKKWTKAYQQEILNSRVFSTRLLKALLSEHANEVKHVISASAIGIYTDSKTNYYEENSNEFSTNFLGKVVQAWEEEVAKLNHLRKVSMVRIGLVLDKNGGAFPKLVAPIKFGAGATFGDGSQWQSWIHINDLVRIFIFLAQNELGGVFNAVAPNPVTNKMMTQEIAQKLKRPLLLPGIPKFAMQLVLGEMHQLLYESQRVSSDKLIDRGFEFQYPQLSQALDELIK
ncbi:MAG: TIGR01777 family oxidoreductase [Flavobacteriales bacterium]|nr:TIGR01777 family oxidoreductase [Flavobacteriales bacterium]